MRKIKVLPLSPTACQVDLTGEESVRRGSVNPIQREQDASNTPVLMAIRSKEVNVEETSRAPTAFGHTSREAAWLEKITKIFSKIAANTGRISLQQFQEALELKDTYFAEGYFRYFDHDNSGYIDLNEFTNSLKDLLNKTDREKLLFLFNIFDVNSDGNVSRYELRRVLKACVAESELSLSDAQINCLVAALLKAADKDGDGNITFDELCLLFQKYPAILDNLTISPANWLKVPSAAEQEKKRWPRLRMPKWKQYFSVAYFHNHINIIIFFIIYIALNIGTFTINVLRYHNAVLPLIIARGCGEALNFNSAFIVLFMLRYTLTAMRNTPIGPFLPIDKSIFIHKIVGWVILVFSIIHTIAHFFFLDFALKINLFNNTNLTYGEALFTNHSGLGWVNGLAYVSGDILLVILIVMVVLSLPCVRGSGYFQVFYWSHFLAIFYWIFLIIHGPIFWYWFVVPGSIYVIEKIYAIVMATKQSASNKFIITRVRLLPSKVVHMVIRCPDDFRFTAGDYVLVRIPEIALFEWHPFTISSAPEMKGIITLHLRGLGKWTNRLYDFYANKEHLKAKNAVKTSADEGGELAKVLALVVQMALPGAVDKLCEHLPTSYMPENRRIYLEGPYGTPVHGLTQTDHAVMIAAGIGVTPFASILQSLLIQNKNKNQKAGKEFDFSLNLDCKVKRVDFIWVNRHVENFEWFLTLLTQLEMQETIESGDDRFLHLQLYLTSAKTREDLKGVGLQLALDFVHQEEHRDLLTGLKTKLRAGRPDWHRLFQGISEKKLGHVHVYFCGSNTLSHTVKKNCRKFGFQYSHSF